MGKQLILGAANFGMPYGLRKSENFRAEESQKILEWARGRIEYIDCAPEYLGADNLLQSFNSDYKFFTKVSTPTAAQKYKAKDLVVSELRRLKVKQIHGVLVRSPNWRESTHLDFMHEILELKDEGLVNKVGLSIYDTTELEDALELSWGLDVMQVPENIANRAFSNFFHTNVSASHRFEYQVRSIFLQGLLTMPFPSIPEELKEVMKIRHELKKTSKRFNISYTQLIVGYIRQLAWVNSIVIGFDTLLQVKEFLALYQTDDSIDFNFINDLPILSKKTIDPRLWN